MSDFIFGIAMIALLVIVTFCLVVEPKSSTQEKGQGKKG